ncbi:Leucyl-tRNA synthetase, mitochondrial [Ascosphaera acerosa]|nr:Leucyl-tRNA synthetase, mitochondrial [Ascosphaera acerosa]
MLFAAPVSEVLDWEEGKIVGIQRWFARVWRATVETRRALARASLSIAPPDTPALPPLQEMTQQEAEVLLAADATVKSVTDCLEKNPYGLNTVISDLTKLTNALSPLPSSASSASAVSYAVTSVLLRLLAPVAPAVASECWTELHGTEASSVLSAAWPAPLLTDADAAVLRARGATTSVGVQVNGRLRFSVHIPRYQPPQSLSPQHDGGADQTQAEKDWVVAQVLQTPEGRLWLQERNRWEARKRVVVVKGGSVVNVVF